MKKNKLVKAGLPGTAMSKQVAADFPKKTDRRLRQLSDHPFTGIVSEKVKDVRAVWITRHNRLYYKVKGNKVAILNMYDRRMNPEKRKY